MAEEARKQAKTNRRTAKSAFTRVGKSLVHAVEHKRPPVEVRQVLSKLQSGSQINFRCRVSLAIFDLLNTRCFRHGNCIIGVGIYSDIEIVHNRAH